MVRVHRAGPARPAEGRTNCNLLLRKGLTKLRFKFENGCIYLGRRLIDFPQLYFLDSALANVAALDAEEPAGVVAAVYRISQWLESLLQWS